MRLIHEADLPDLATGAAILGTGGGGNPYRGMLVCSLAIREHGPVTLLDPDELADDDLVIPVAGIGAPTVGMEKINNGGEGLRALRALEAYLGKKARATVPIEIGGGNSTGPIRVAAMAGLPVVDADGMGRAYPEVQQVTPTIWGVKAAPIAMADSYGNALILETVDNRWAERLARSATIQMGGGASMAVYPMTGKQIKETMVPRTLTLAQRVGQAIRTARAAHADPVQATLDVLGGYRIFEGKVEDVDRRTATGFARGRARIRGAGEVVTIEFQNEFLIARSEERLLCVTPDLIMLVDSQTGEPVTTEAVRYGFRVAILGIPCDWRWRTPGGLALAGPGYFGYDVDYVPVEELVRR